MITFSRLVVVAAALFATGCAHAGPAQSWSELYPRLKHGTPVAVTDASGGAVSGKISSASSSLLRLDAAGGPRQFAPDQVREVRRDGDALWNGLLIGAGVGALGAVLPDHPCTRSAPGMTPDCSDPHVAQRLSFLAAMTALGIGLDALHRDHSVLYEPGTRPRAAIVPDFSSRSAGVTLSIQF
jgi:hypothetical protein